MTIAWPRWLRSRKSDADQSAEIFERFFADMRDGGWHPWIYDHPRSNDPVEVIRYEWWPDGVMVWRPLEIRPETNVAGLYWRPLGNVIDVTPTTPARVRALP